MVQNAANWLKSGQKDERERPKFGANYLFWSHFFSLEWGGGRSVFCKI